MVSFITAIGMLAIVSGGLTYVGLPVGLKMGLNEFINLKENGMVYPQYMNPPFMVDSVYYIYEIKNPKEVLQGGKMELNLKGPYKFKTATTRANIKFSGSGEKISFDSGRKLHANEAESKDFDEKFYMVNPVVPSLLSSVKSIVLDRVPFQRVSQPIILNGLNVVLDSYRERLIAKRTPRDLLEGRKVEILQNVVDLAVRFGVTSLLPPTPPENTFGLAHYQNFSTEMAEIWTGVGPTKGKFAEVSKWRNKEKADIWTGKCSAIEGTNGELFKPFLTKGKSIRVFLGQLCRSFDLDPIGEVEIQNGLKAYEYEISGRLYLGSRNNPNNKCFCKDTRTYDCQFDGFISMGPCFLGSPAFFAKPNMKGVDRRIRRMVKEETIEYPIPDKQSFYLDPVTGTLLRVNLTITGAFKIVRQPYLRDMAKIQNLTYAPLFSVSETVILPNSLTRPVKAVQIMVQNYESASIVGVLGGSGILLLRLLGGGKSSSKSATKNSVTGAIAAAPVPAANSNNNTTTPSHNDSSSRHRESPQATNERESIDSVEERKETA